MNVYVNLYFQSSVQILHVHVRKPVSQNQVWFWPKQKLFLFWNFSPIAKLSQLPALAFPIWVGLYNFSYILV